MNKLTSRATPLVIGALFLISGVSKAIDPFGGALKIDEYIATFNLSWIQDYATMLAVLLASLEMIIGLFILFDIWRRITAAMSFLFIFAFSIITAFLAFDPYISINECGCFGEAVKLTNIQTFVKNIVLLGVVTINVLCVFKTQHIGKKKILLSIYLVFFSLSIPLYSLYYLPPYDFLPFNTGISLDSRSSFKIFDKEYLNVTDSILGLTYNKPLLAVVSHNELEQDDVIKIKRFAKDYSKQYHIIALSGLNNSIEDIENYYVDATILKELLRAKAGVILIEKGLIANKWNLRRCNEDSIIKKAPSRRLYICTVLIGLAL